MNALRRLLLLAMVVPLFALGCGGGDDRPTVAFVTNNPETFWGIAEVGAKKAANEYKARLLFRKPSTQDVKLQKELIDDVVGQGAKAVAVSVIDPKNQSEYLDEIAAKTKLLTQDNDAPKTKRLAYLGTDNYNAGRAAGKLVREALGEKGGTVMIFVGSLGPLNARQRRQGVIDELAGAKAPDDVNEIAADNKEQTHGAFKFPPTFTDQPEGAKKARTNAEEALAKVTPGDNVCMVGLWAYNPPQMLGALRDNKTLDAEAKKKVKIVAFDEDFATLDGIKSGEVYGTIVQDPHGFGYEAVKLMAALAKGDESGLPKGGIKFIPYRVIMKDAGEKDGLKRLAVDAFRADLEKLLGTKK